MPLTSRPITLPLSAEVIETLHAGDRVYLSGKILTARDAAHKRLVDTLARQAALPLPLAGETIYYVGPTPAQNGRPMGSAGPTTSDRMDPFTPALLAEGLKGMIGKGPRSETVRSAILQHRAVYFAATGGIGALLAEKIIRSEIVAYADLGTEAIRRLTIEAFPVVVAVDSFGGKIYGN